MSSRKILVLWNQPEEDVYEQWRDEGPRPLDWDPSRTAPIVSTVAEEIDDIVAAVGHAGHQVVSVNLHDDFPRLIATLDRERPDAIVNLVDFFGDDVAFEANIAGVFELMGVAYTGSRPSALQTCLRKHRTKALLAQAGLPTAPYVVVDPREPTIDDDHGLTFPVIVKPALEDASGGIDDGAVVSDQEALEARVAKALHEYEMPVLVEEYIDGRELHCALIGDPLTALPLFEMIFTERLDGDGNVLPKIVTFRAKWDPHSRDFFDIDSKCPVDDLEPEITAAIQDVARRAARVVGVRDYARVDMRVDTATGEPFVLEVNPNPDLADHGAFIQCAIASGRSFESTIGEIVGLALARADRARARAKASGDQLLREHREQREREVRRRTPTIPPKSRP